MRHLSATLVLFVLLLNSNVFAKQKTRILLPEKKYNRTVKVLSNQVLIRFRHCDYNFDNLMSKLNKFGITFEKQLLGKKQSFTFAKKKLNVASLSDNKLKVVLKKEEPLLRTYRVSYSSDVAPEVLCWELIKRFPEIEIAEPVVVDEILGSYIPNDKYVYQQGLLAQCKIFDFWDEWKGDTNTVIGISDGGVFQQHEDLINSIAPNWGEITDYYIDND
jgi:hypothetical protein